MKTKAGILHIQDFEQARKQEKYRPDNSACGKVKHISLKVFLDDAFDYLFLDNFYIGQILPRLHPKSNIISNSVICKDCLRVLNSRYNTNVSKFFNLKPITLNEKYR